MNPNQGWGSTLLAITWDETTSANCGKSRGELVSGQGQVAVLWLCGERTWWTLVCCIAGNILGCGTQYDVNAMTPLAGVWVLPLAIVPVGLQGCRRVSSSRCRTKQE